MTIKSGEIARGLPWKLFELHDFDEDRCKNKRRVESQSSEVGGDIHCISGENPYHWIKPS